MEIMRLALQGKVPGGPDFTVTDEAHEAAVDLLYEANLMWPEALGWFEKAYERAPENPVWVLHIALGQRETGDPEGALATAREAGPISESCGA